LPLLILQITELADKFGLPFAGAIIVISVMASVVIFLDRRADRLYGLRLHEMEVGYDARLRDQETQFLARLQSQEQQYEARISEYHELSKLHSLLLRRGIDIQDLTIKELAPRSRE
jgi:hypothetical protein